MFLGDKLKGFCGDGGGGSAWRLAVTMLAGGKQKGFRRKMKAAREQLMQMSDDQIMDLARARGAATLVSGVV